MEVGRKSREVKRRCMCRCLRHEGGEGRSGPFIGNPRNFASSTTSASPSLTLAIMKLVYLGVRNDGCYLFIVSAV